MVPACLTSLLNDYENGKDGDGNGGICDNSFMDSTVTYTGVFTYVLAVDVKTIDYSGVWKVSSGTCTGPGTAANTIVGNDPTESVPTITAGRCSDNTEVRECLIQKTTSPRGLRDAI